MNSKKRFEFGKNWKNFIKTLDDEKIENSKKSLLSFLELKNLNGKSFLDAGCGSGLSSLVARKSGANVFSFDFDKDSVQTTLVLKNNFYPQDKKWSISHGSVLDNDFLKKLGKFDIVYSWGVLHHSGNMIKALNNIEKNLKNNGILFISIYNDQGIKSSLWKIIKKAYVKIYFLRPVIILFGYIYFGPSQVLKLILNFLGFNFHKKYKKKRGMSFHHDIIDWIGGYPFEVASPEVIIDFYLKKGYNLKKLKTCQGRLGCNEFIFQKT